MSFVQPSAMMAASISPRFSWAQIVHTLGMRSPIRCQKARHPAAPRPDSLQPAGPTSFSVGPAGCKLSGRGAAGCLAFWQRIGERMPRVCTICAHEKRGEIEAAIIADGCTKDIAQRFAVSVDSLKR